jgi:hypothetical protein
MCYCPACGSREVCASGVWLVEDDKPAALWARWKRSCSVPHDCGRRVEMSRVLLRVTFGLKTTSHLISESGVLVELSQQG